LHWLARVGGEEELRHLGAIGARLLLGIEPDLEPSLLEAEIGEFPDNPLREGLGAVSALPSEPAVLGSGSKARVLEVKLGDGRSVTVPRANIELIET
jgi:hypothetical protein